jgi:cobalt-zinc-cadmium efflux system outer membrane protein
MLNHKLAKSICTLCCIYFLQTNITLAQEHTPLPSPDTLRVDLRHAEKMFLENNLQLLAQKYSIDSARAAIITAKLFDNPQFGVSSGLYNPTTSRFFDYSNGNGEVAMQLSQLIKTAGKRNKNIQLAKTGVALTEYQFSDILRTLEYTLRNDFFNIYYLRETQKVYDIEISSLQTTNTAYSEQLKKGNVSELDLIRIQSQQYTLQAELATLQNNIDDVESELKLLLRAKATIYIVPQYEDAEDKQQAVTDLPLQSLVDSAYQNRADLKIARTTVTFNQQNLALQKALAVPDINIDLGYDRLGSYVKDYNSIGVDFPLPFFNRNQGNIKQAKLGVQSSQVQLESTQDAVESQIANSYLGAVRAEKLLNSFDPKFAGNIDHLIGEVTKNFQAHNISLLEFTDFYDSYKQNVVQLNNLRYSRVSQLEQLNFNTGTRIFNK